MIVPATPEHLPLIAAAMPSEGVRELAEVYGQNPEETLRRNLLASTEAWTMFHDTVPLAIFGVAPLSVMEGRGEFWVIGTTHICAHRLSFARSCRKFLPRLMRDWNEVIGLLEHGRPDVVKWAAWLGTKITPVDDRMSFMSIQRSA